MKKLFFIFHFSFFICAAVAQAPSADIPHQLDPRVVSIGKELPRGDVVSHGSREEALSGTYHSSKYLQPLTEWTENDRPDAVVYSTRYKIPFEWIDREMFLYLGKVSASFDVVINGELVGYSQTGSTPSEFDVTKASQEGNNDLEIVVYKEPVALELENSREPIKPRILGEVYVLSQPRMRVRDIFVDTRMEGTGCLLEFGVIMKSHQLNAKEYRVYYELVSHRGEILSEGYKDAELDMQREDTVRFFSRIQGILPWSHEEPRLYTLFIKTQHEGRFKEFLAFQIGFRGLEFRDGLIYLNNTPLKITMREFTPTADMEQMRAQIEALKASGVNTLNLQGGPTGHDFYELCDELGVYICNGADIDTHLAGTSRKVGGNPSNAPEWDGAYLDRVMSMYHTSKNSPSVVMFSLADESANGYNLYESYLALKATEKRRPVVYPEGAEWNNDPLDFIAMDKISYPTGEQWAVVTALDAQSGRFRVLNTRYITPISGEADYKIVVGKKVVSKGVIPVEVLPQQTTDLTIPISNVKEGKEFVVQIEVKIPRRITEYVPLPATKERKVFAGEIPLSEQEKIVIGQGDFPSEK